MRSSRWTLSTLVLSFPLWAAGCGDKEGEETGTGPGLLDGTIYPSAEEILIFNGNGGADGDGGGEGGVETVTARWQAMGYLVRVKDELPSDLSKYRAIVMMAPGYFGGAASFIYGDIEEIARVMGNGARLIILSENGACGEAAVNDLLTQLGVSIRFNGDGAQENSVLEIAKFGYDSQVTEGLTALQFTDPCYVDNNNGVSLFADDDGHILGAAEQIGNGGDVVIIGDIRFLDDDGYIDVADNGRLADNLVVIKPSSDSSAE